MELELHVIWGYSKLNLIHNEEHRIIEVVLCNFYLTFSFLIRAVGELSSTLGLLRLERA